MQLFHISFRVATITLVCITATAQEQEIPPVDALPCFPGAFYRKAVSSTDKWTGIEGVISLPTPVLDEDRKSAAGRHMDNPSVYLGGNAGTEFDAGVTWSRIRRSDGRLTPHCEAFRIFWRYQRWYTGPLEPEYCYYPGDKLRLRCVVIAQGKMLFEVELLERGPNAPLPVDNKPRFGSGPLSRYSVEIDARDFKPDRSQQFKRVNAIDQVGREGKEVIPTKAKVLGAVWHEVSLFRGFEKVPMNPGRFTDMRCPALHHVKTAAAAENGAETISLFGSAVDNQQP
jgi:hypothetical protein